MPEHIHDCDFLIGIPYCVVDLLASFEKYSIPIPLVLICQAIYIHIYIYAVDNIYIYIGIYWR